MGPLDKILENPLLLVSCKDNETVFSLYNISLWDDLGFQADINKLLNGTTLPSFFPQNSSVDNQIQQLENKQADLENQTASYLSTLSQNQVNLMNFLIQLQNLSAQYNCTPNPPNCTVCCHIDNMENSTQTILSLFDNINSSLSDLQNQTSSLNSLIDKLKNARRSIVNTLAQSLQFPDLSTGLGSNIVNTLGDCAWLGNFWRNIIGDAICSRIVPALLWVGWSFAEVGIVMILLTPVIIWSLNLDENGML